MQFLSLGGVDVPGSARRSSVTRQLSRHRGLRHGAAVSSACFGGEFNGDTQRQDNFNYRFAASYITGSHAVKAGLQGLRGTFNTRGNVPTRLGSGLSRSAAALPKQLTQSADPFMAQTAA